MADTPTVWGDTLTVPREVAETIIDWWRGANEAPGGISALEAIQGMRDAVYELEQIRRAAAEEDRK